MTNRWILKFNKLFIKFKEIKWRYKLEKLLLEIFRPILMKDKKDAKSMKEQDEVIQGIVKDNIHSTLINIIIVMS